MSPAPFEAATQIWYTPLPSNQAVLSVYSRDQWCLQPGAAIHKRAHFSVTLDASSSADRFFDSNLTSLDGSIFVAGEETLQVVNGFHFGTSPAAPFVSTTPG
jgi:hypothetical protein